MNVRELRPVANKLIVEVIKEVESTTESGIILGVGGDSQDEETHPHDTVRARVLAAGINNEFIYMDTIIYYEHRHSLPIFNGDYRVLKASDVLALDLNEEE